MGRKRAFKGGGAQWASDNICCASQIYAVFVHKLGEKFEIGLYCWRSGLGFPDIRPTGSSLLRTEWGKKDNAIISKVAKLDLILTFRKIEVFTEPQALMRDRRKEYYNYTNGRGVGDKCFQIQPSASGDLTHKPTFRISVRHRLENSRYYNTQNNSNTCEGRDLKRPKYQCLTK